MRRFWLPALASSELPEPGGDPLAIQMLNERLVAFRGEDGKVGIIDEYCRHRGASLALGRVENCGVRCIYHGWKFGADGEVQETPNVSDPQFKTRFKAKAYPTREAGGLVWVYMGDPAEVPALPESSVLFLGGVSARKQQVPTIRALAGSPYHPVVAGGLESSVRREDLVAG